MAALVDDDQFGSSNDQSVWSIQKKILKRKY
jgi:hypothetical protein